MYFTSQTTRPWVPAAIAALNDIANEIFPPENKPFKRNLVKRNPAVTFLTDIDNLKVVGMELNKGESKLLSEENPY